MNAPFAPGHVRVGCTVSLRVAKDGQEGTIQWLISRGRTRVSEGVLGRRTRLAKALLGRHVGEILTPDQTGSPFWLRIEAIEMPVATAEELEVEPATLYSLGGMSVRISYEEGWTGPLPEDNPAGAGDGSGDQPYRGGYWDDADL